MGNVRQGIKRKYAKHRDAKKRLTAKTIKYTYSNKRPTETKKYAYTKKVLVNGKYRYYYA